MRVQASSLRFGARTKLDIGKPGRVQASQGVRLMNVPANVTRAAGDVHALGNPHFGVDPIIAKAIAQHIAQSFSAIDPANAAAYDANYKKFEAAINAKLQQWGAALLPFKGQHAEVIAQMKAQKIKAIIVEPYHDRKIAERVASATGAKVVDFAQYPGALPGTDNYIKLIDALVSRLAAALK